MKPTTMRLPVDWFDPDHLKEGAYITAGSGGVALPSRGPHPNAAKLAINWLLSREGQAIYQKLFTLGEEGPDSLRIDIPKDKVPRGNRRPDGDESRYPFVDAPSGWIWSRSASSSRKHSSGNGKNRDRDRVRARPALRDI